jgi:hypothetical protein
MLMSSEDITFSYISLKFDTLFTYKGGKVFQWGRGCNTSQECLKSIKEHSPKYYYTKVAPSGAKDQKQRRIHLPSFQHKGKREVI